MEIISERIKKEELNSALKIYNYFISNSLSNFEEKNLSLNSFFLLHRKIRSKKLPFIIAKNDDEVVGLAFVNNFRNKSGYRFAFEHSIYVKPNCLNNGYGTKILKELIKYSKKNKKIKNLIAVIGGSNNISSIKIHKKNGFNYVGTLKKIGFKKNKLIDSVYMQKKL